MRQMRLHPPARRALSCLVLAVVAPVRSGAAAVNRAAPARFPTAPVNWMHRVRCPPDYELLVTERDDAIFARTATLNWIVDREDDNRLYFVNSREWELHYFFASAYLNKAGLTPVGTHAEFNILNYRRENRRFLLGKVIRYLDQGLLTLEFSAGDTASADMIVEGYRAWRRVCKMARAPVPPGLQRPGGKSRRVERANSGDTHRRGLSGAELPAAQCRAGLWHAAFPAGCRTRGRPGGPTDIVVLDRVPNDISLVSGIITDEFQTPLSHVDCSPRIAARPTWACATRSTTTSCARSKASWCV